MFRSSFLQMANPELEEPQIKIEEPTTDEQQPQEVIVEEITHNITPQTSTSPPTVITTPRHRMITTAGRIRYIQIVTRLHMLDLISD